MVATAAHRRHDLPSGPYRIGRRLFLRLPFFPSISCRPRKDIDIEPSASVSPVSLVSYLQSDKAVMMGKFYLDLRGKIGYLGCMLRSILFFALRFSLILAIWAFLWRYLEPKTQLMRIMRAALLLLCLLGVMAVVKLTGP